MLNLVGSCLVSFLPNSTQIFNLMGELLWLFSSFMDIVREKTDDRREVSQREVDSITLSEVTGWWRLCDAVQMSCFHAASYEHLHRVSVSIHSLIFLKSSKMTAIR